MGFLCNENQIIYLRSLHVFGRNPVKVDTILSNPDASNIHMAITWNELQWEITDYSRNGTFIDGKQLPTNIKTKLKVGQQIQCGPGGNVAWKVGDLHPPCPMLLAMNEHTSAIVLNDFHFFPDEINTIASVYFSNDGHWVWDTETGIRVLKDGDLIEISDKAWQCAFPQEIEPTGDVRAKSDFDALKFDFVVSQNEEHVFLAIDFAGEQINLGERTHHYSLLTLARRRFEDHQRGLDDFSQGWVPVEDLSTMLGLEPTHLNTQLFRARTQIMREIQSNNRLPDVIERRRGEIRFSSHPFRIMRGKQLEASFNCNIA